MIFIVIVLKRAEYQQSAAELWPKTIFNMEAVRHLEFKKVVFGHVTVIELKMCCCVTCYLLYTKFIQNLMIFSL